MIQNTFSPEDDVFLKIQQQYHELHYNKEKRRLVYSILFLIVSIAVFSSTTLLVLASSNRRYVSLEPETGNLSGNASVVNNGAVSGGKYIDFVQPAPTPTPPVQQQSALQRAMVQAPHYGAALYWPKAGVSYATEYSTHVQRVGQGKKPDMLRVFVSNNEGSWSWNTLAGGSSGRSSPTVTGHNKGVWISFKTDLAGAANGNYNSNWTSSINSVPRDGRPKMFTIHHEPENDLPGSNYDAWVLNWMRANINVGRAIKAANHPDIVYGPIWMGSWYITGVPANHPSNLHRWMQLANNNGLMDDLLEVWDYIGWDPYHEGSHDSPPRVTAPRNTAAHYFDAPYNFSQKYFPNKPIAIGETGYHNGVSESARLAWLQSVKSWVDARPNKVLAVCYYDASIQVPWYLSLGTGGTVGEPYQTGPAQFWGSLYRP